MMAKTVGTVRKILGSHELYVKAESIAIENKKTSTYMVLSLQNFITLLSHKSIIDKKFMELCRLNARFNNFHLDIGDGFIVSITFGNKWLDIRKSQSMECAKLTRLDWVMINNHLDEIFKLRPDIRSLFESSTGYCKFVI
jgi:hypothetical protein